MKTLTFRLRDKMCMNISPNVLETLKLFRFTGIDFFFQPNGFVSWCHRERPHAYSEIQNAAVFSKRKTSWNWILQPPIIKNSILIFDLMTSLRKPPMLPTSTTREEKRKSLGLRVCPSPLCTCAKNITW